jgi:hypothetical protein
MTPPEILAHGQRPIGRLARGVALAERSALTRLLFGRAVFQGKAETIIGVLETIVDLLDIDQLLVIDLLQGRLDGLNLQHAIGNGFTF